jgi:hypothetical protein
VPDSKPPDAVESWIERILSLRNARRESGRVVLWEAVSEACDGGGFVAAGAVRLPQDDVMDLEEFAYALRGLLQRTTGDPTVTVQLIEPGEDATVDRTAAAEGAVAAFYDTGDGADAGENAGGIEDEDAGEFDRPSGAWDR